MILSNKYLNSFCKGLIFWNESYMSPFFGLYTFLYLEISVLKKTFLCKSRKCKKEITQLITYTNGTFSKVGTTAYEGSWVSSLKQWAYCNSRTISLYNSKYLILCLWGIMNFDPHSKNCYHLTEMEHFSWDGLHTSQVVNKKWLLIWELVHKGTWVLSLIKQDYCNYKKKAILPTSYLDFSHSKSSFQRFKMEQQYLKVMC